MPVEIRELIIRTTIVNGGNGELPATNGNGQNDEAIIAACVEQVLKILERKKQR